MNYPLMLKCFFATDENNNFMESSYFIVTDPKNLSSKELNFF